MINQIDIKEPANKLNELEDSEIIENLFSEMADIEIMLEQLKDIDQIEQSDIDDVKAYKINRQLKRIAEELENAKEED